MQGPTGIKILGLLRTDYTKNKRLNPLMLASIRLAIAGAEKVNENVRKEFKIKFGIEIYEGYGTTETAPVVSVNTPNVLEPDFFKELHFNREKSVGLPLAGTVIKITDPASPLEAYAKQNGIKFFNIHHNLHDSQSSSSLLVTIVTSPPEMISLPSIISFSTRSR